MTYARAMRRLMALTNYESEMPSNSEAFKRDNGKIFAAKTAKALAKIPIVHVAGTKGKGSTCAMIEALCRNAGLKTGFYSSPHLVDMRERIQLNRKLVSKASLGRHLNALFDDTDYGYLTFFEAMTYSAVLAFIEAKCDVIILETGLGGRLDSTNVFKPAVTVITRIGKDHTHILGNTLAAIAGEKAGIIKTRTPIITCAQSPAAAKVIRDTAHKKRAPYILARKAPSAPLAGDHQRTNFAMALATLDVLAGKKMAPKNWDNNINSLDVQWQGRFQIISAKPPIVLDGAHNPEATRALVTTWQQRYPNTKAHVVFGSTSDKDWQESLRVLAPITKQLHTCPITSNRTVSEADIAKFARSLALKSKSHPSLAAAHKALPKTQPKLYTGSLYLVGEVLALNLY